MNKSKHSIPLRARKKMKKELRSGVVRPDTVLQANPNTTKALLSRVPPKLRKKDASILKSFEKNVVTKKKKQKSSVSKRTNPGIDVKSPPHFAHIEGERWIKTLGKQTQAKRKVMTRQMTKKGSK